MAAKKSENTSEAPDSGSLPAMIAIANDSAEIAGDRPAAAP